MFRFLDYFIFGYDFKNDLNLKCFNLEKSLYVKAL